MYVEHGYVLVLGGCFYLRIQTVRSHYPTYLKKLTPQVDCWLLFPDTCEAVDLPYRVSKRKLTCLEWTSDVHGWWRCLPLSGYRGQSSFCLSGLG